MEKKKSPLSLQISEISPGKEKVDLAWHVELQIENISSMQPGLVFFPPKGLIWKSQLTEISPEVLHIIMNLILSHKLNVHAANE